MPACRIFLIALVPASLLAVTPPAGAQDAGTVLTGAAAFGDWHGDAPGVRRLIRPEDLPAPGASRSSANRAGVVARPDGAMPVVPDGFAVSLFAEGLDRPRTIRVAPNGDIFVAEVGAGSIRVLRPTDGAREPSEATVFADGLSRPYGIAFYPPGPEPQFVYVAETDRVVRFPYRSGDLEAGGPAETVVAELPSGGHWTRDIAFSPDGSRMYVAVGSDSNVAQGIERRSASEVAEFEASRGLGAAWGEEENRAAVLVFDPDGGNGRIFAAGIRNCSGLAVEPQTGDLWCATNERDGLGDDLPPDYLSRIGEGTFYGWPWYYIGDNEDPRHGGARPDLAGKVTVPDVLIQPHSAPLGIAFYDQDAFPDEYRGDGFATLHGSWNRGSRTGYKVVRIILENGVPTGEYEDFMTGFVLSDDDVWGRPVGIAVAKDGALLISEDGNDTIWRVAPADAR
jgi:glucose/arabinose dehydrogenase